MPVFDLARMQVLYSVTPLIILMLGLASVWGLEKRGAPAPEARSFNTIASSLALLRGNMQAQRFFACVILTFIGIFTQDLLQEVWAGELFGMTAGPSVLFQQLFNGLVTLGMAAGGIATAVVLKRRGSAAKTLPVDERRWIGVRAGMIASIGFVTLALASARSDFTTALLGFVLQGAAVGVYTFAAVTMMSDMTVEGLTANYLGLWSIAQAIGLGASFVVSGLLHSLLRDVAMLPLTQVYAAIFLLQATAMLVCTALMRGASVERLRISAPGVSGSSAPVPLEVA
jgi:BCD family chlorophyll transporter-like MFS transporter